MSLLPPTTFKLPTVLAKIFGFYSIGFKNAATGKSMRMDVLIMENLFYQRNVKKASPFQRGVLKRNCRGGPHKKKEIANKFHSSRFLI